MKQKLLFLFTLITTIAGAQTLDKSFGFGGKTFTLMQSPTIVVTNSFLLADNRLIISGAQSQDGYGQSSFLGSFNSDGKPSYTFNTTGVITTHNGQVSGFAAQQPFNKIVVASWHPGSDGFNQQTYISRYTPTGQIDASFGVNGYASYSAYGGFYQFPTSIATDKTGNIYVGGEFNDQPGNTLVIKLKSNGSIDSSFKVSGTPTSVCRSVLLLNNNSLLAGIYDETAAGYTASIIKFKASGKTDKSFANNGILNLNNLIIGSTDQTVYLQQTAGGAFIAMYHNGNDLLFQKFNANGSPDNSFGVNSIVNTQGANSATFAIDDKGYILQPLFGFRVKRYTGNGAVDVSFGVNGILTTTFKEFRLSNNDFGSFSNIVPVQGGFYATGAYSDGDINYDLVAAKYNTGANTATAVDNISVQKNTGTAKIIIAPNPIHDVLNINNLPAKSHIVIIRSDGTIVQTANATSGTLKLNVGNLSSGVYYVMVEETNQKERFVKF